MTSLGGSVTSFIVSPDGKGGVYIFALTYWGVSVSVDNGTSWTSLNSGLAYSVASIAISPASSGPGGMCLFAGTYGGGVWRYPLSEMINNDTSWSAVCPPGPYNNYISSFGFSPAGDSNVFASIYYGGIYRSTNNGKSWSPVDSQLIYGVYCVVAIPDSSGSGTILLAGCSKGICLSTDNGKSWTYPGGAKKSFNGGAVWSILAIPDGAGRTNIFAGTKRGVALSTDRGKTWTTTSLNASNITAFAVSAYGGGTNIFAAYRNYLYLTTDNGTNWTIVDSTISSRYSITSLAANNTDLFTGVQFRGPQKMGGGQLGGLFRSADNGATWSAVPLGLMTVYAIAVDGPNLFAGTYGGGVFLSTDYGESWTTLNSGLKSTCIYTLAIRRDSSASGTLFAGTANGGVWTWPLSAVATCSAINLTATGGSTTAAGVAHPSTRTGGLVEKQSLSKTVKSSPRTISSYGGNGRILLNWTRDHHADFMRYRIYADTLLHPVTLVDSTSGGVAETLKVVYGLADGKTYHFRVTAVDNTGLEDNYSNEVTASTDIFIPKLMLTAIPGNGQVVLQWNRDNHADFMHYCLYGDTLPHPVTVIDSAITSVTDTMRVIHGLANGTAYYYRIATVDSLSFESDSSSDVPAMPDIFIYSLNIGWNMVAVPLTVRDCRRSALFPFAGSNAFCFEETYVMKDTLAYGIGHWLRLNSSQYVSMDGAVRALDTIDVREGWNMVGSISAPVAAAQITSDPGGLVTSQFYGYAHGYHISDTIQPGRGYWVKMSQGGKLVLSSSGGSARASNRIRIVPSQEQPPAPPKRRNPQSAIGNPRSLRS